jgi:glycosyltransferase involved in cell wall biosynthesis
MPSLASIVIPAHNEEHRIRELLGSLSDLAIAGDYDIYVICNGCRDRTRQVAEEYPGIVVVEIPDAGKHFALNEGDRLAGDVYPRLYCDADTHISPASIRALVDILTTDDVVAAGPRVRYGDEKSAWTVKLYCRALESPLMVRWLDDHLTGRGLYGASRAARRRFEAFPPMFADDLFFDSQFDLSEKKVVHDCAVTVWVPNRLGALLWGEVRVSEGNQQFRVVNNARADSTVPEGSRDNSRFRLVSRMRTLRVWWRDLRRRDVVPLTVFLGIAATAKMILAAKKMRGHEIRWR